jgi:hypothetical protein
MAQAALDQRFRRARIPSLTDQPTLFGRCVALDIGLRVIYSMGARVSRHGE